MSARRAVVPRVRVYCDDPAALTPSGKPWHARGARVLGDYLRTETATGAPLWEELPDVPSRARRTLAARGGSVPVGVPTDGGGRLMYAESLWDHSFRTGPPTLRAVRDGKLLTPPETGRVLWEAQRGIDRETGEPVDVAALAGLLYFAWRCPCEQELVCPHGDVAPILDAQAARGRDRVSLAELAEWVGDTPTGG